MFTLKLDSSREQHSKDTTYVLSAGDIISALEPRLLADMHLTLRFNARQAYWKEQRETIDENGTYSLMHCNYRYSRPRVDSWISTGPGQLKRDRKSWRQASRQFHGAPFRLACRCANPFASCS